MPVIKETMAPFFPKGKAKFELLIGV